MRRKKLMIAALLFIVMLLPGCDLIVDIFAAGVIVGIIVVILIVAFIVWGISKFID